MRKLLKRLERWRLIATIPTKLTKWQREIIYNFIIDYIREVTKDNG